MKRRFVMLAVLAFIVVASLYAISQSVSRKPKVLLIAENSDQELLKLISLDRSTFEFVSDPKSDFNAVLVYNSTLSEGIIKWIEAGGTAVIFPGKALLQNCTLSSVLGLEYRNDSISIEEAENSEEAKDVIVKYIAWNSAPAVKERLVVGAIKGVRTYVYGVRKDGRREPFLVEIPFGNGSILFVSAIVGGKVNEDFKYWPQFAYMAYILTCRATGVEPKRFSYWDYSPVPHGAQKIYLAVITTITVLATSAAFLYVRSYSKKHPLDRRKLGAIVQLMEEKEGVSKWEEVGFHRQLANFSILMLLNAIVLPFTLIWSILWMRYLVKYPMAQGIYDWTINFWNVVWFVFDAGTFLAATKYFSEYRVKDPIRAVKHIQFLAWWQMITGSIQLALVVYLVNLAAFGDDLMYFSWVFIAVMISQFPGIFNVFVQMFKAMQRFDYAQYITVAVTSIAGPILAGIMAVVFREVWVDYTISPVLRTVIGIFVGNYIANWVMLGMSAFFLRKLKISITALLRVDFDASIVKEALTYGIKGRVGDYAVTGAWALQMFLLSNYVRGYAEWQGYFSFIWGLGVIYQVLCGFVIDTMQAISEAYGYKLYDLTNLYIAEAFVFVYLISYLVSVLFLSIGDIYILVLYGERWLPAAVLIPYMVLFFMLSPPAWIHDQVQFGCGYPGYRSLVTVIEQVLRVILFIPFLIWMRLQIFGVFYAYIIALTIKDVVTSLISYKKIIKFKMYPWNSIIAPGIAAGATYAVIEVMRREIWSGDLGGLLSSAGRVAVAGIVIDAGFALKVGLMVLALYLAGMLYIFLTGYLHAIDRNLLKDVLKTLETFGPLKFVGKLVGIPWLLEAGIRMSPFKRFTVDIYGAAMEEADRLLEIKKRVLGAGEG